MSDSVTMRVSEDTQKDAAAFADRIGSSKARAISEALRITGHLSELIDGGAELYVKNNDGKETRIIFTAIEKTEREKEAIKNEVA